MKNIASWNNLALVYQTYRFHHVLPMSWKITKSPRTQLALVRFDSAVNHQVLFQFLSCKECLVANFTQIIPTFHWVLRVSVHMTFYIFVISSSEITLITLQIFLVCVSSLYMHLHSTIDYNFSAYIANLGISSMFFLLVIFQHISHWKTFWTIWTLKVLLQIKIKIWLNPGSLLMKIFSLSVLPILITNKEDCLSY